MLKCRTAMSPARSTLPRSKADARRAQQRPAVKMSDSVSFRLCHLGRVATVKQEVCRASATVAELLVPYPGHDLVADHKLIVCVPCVGTKFAISIAWNDTADDIKRKIEARTKLSIEYQVLSVGCAIMEGREQLLTEVANPARPTVHLSVKGASEGEEAAFLRDNLPAVAVTGRFVETLAPESTLAEVIVESNCTLFDCTLFALPRYTPTIELILPLGGGTATIELSGHGMSVGDLKTAVARAHGFERESLRLVFSGRRLNFDKKLLCELGIMDESIVTVLPPPPRPPPAAEAAQMEAILATERAEKSGSPPRMLHTMMFSAAGLAIALAIALTLTRRARK